MRSTVFTLLPFLASAMVLDEPRADADPALFYGALFKAPPMKGFEVKTTRQTRVAQDSIKKTVRYGPFVIPSQKDEPVKSWIPTEKGELQALNVIEPVCNDCFVLRSTTYMEYENGTQATPATGIYNHHAVVYDSERRSINVDCKTKSFSRAKAGPSIFAASAADAGSLAAFGGDSGTPSAIKKGFYTKPNSKMSLMAQLMNYRDEKQTVYIVTEAEYYNGKPEGYMESAGFIIGVNGCDKAIDFLVPTNQYSATSPEFTIPKDTTLVSMSGHMHDGGEDMQLMINGKVACNSKAIYGEALKMDDGMDASGITGMSRCTDPIQLKKGDTLSVKANYDIVKHPMRTSNTGEKETVMGLGLFEVVVPVESDYP